MRQHRRVGMSDASRAPRRLGTPPPDRFAVTLPMKGRERYQNASAGSAITASEPAVSFARHAPASGSTRWRK
jgi:hypothetical protein